MRALQLLVTGAAVLAISGCGSDGGPHQLASAEKSAVTWHLDNLASIGGHAVEVSGNPVLIDTPTGKAIEFDGVDDGIFLDVHPLAGMSTFTVEIVFMPYRGGASEQRYFHMQESSSDDRVMFETRLVGNESWFLDTFVKSGDQRVTLYAKDHEHALDEWHHAAIVVDGDAVEHFVNGRRELGAAIQYVAQDQGKTSIGVRINRVHWFKGAISTVRFTPKPLAPGEFLTAPN